MRAAARWGTALVASGAVHGVAAALVLHGFAPGPPDPQDSPRTRLQVDTVSPQQQTAQAEPLDGSKVDEARADGTPLAVGAIPQTNATPLDAEAPRPPGLAVGGTSLASTPPEAQAVAAVEGPAAIRAQDLRTTRVQEAPRDTQQLAVASPPRSEAQQVIPRSRPQPALSPVPEPAPESTAEAKQATAIAPSGAPGVATALPSDTSEPAALPSGRIAASMPLTDDAPEATPAPDTAAPVVVTGAPVAPDMPEATAADQSPLPATDVMAALAWQFGDRLVTDPRAVATIQAFVSPDDLERAKANAGQVRDDLSALLTDVDCARLSAVFLPETGKLELRGHIPDPQLRAPLLEALRRQTGDGIPINDNLQVLPKPQCNALAGIAAAGLPQSTDQFTDTRLIGETAHARSYAYTEGQRLEFDLAAPDYDAFIYVDYFNAAGGVIHLIPNEIISLRRHDAGSVVGIGQNVPGEPGLRITIGPPYGQEIAVAFAASRPLYDQLRPITEPAAPYLEFLKNRIDAARAADPDFKGEWVYFFLTTSPD